jgi:hypothetical protein
MLRTKAEVLTTWLLKAHFRLNAMRHFWRQSSDGFDLRQATGAVEPRGHCLILRRLARLIGKAKRRAIRFTEHLTGDGPTVGGADRQHPAPLARVDLVLG